MATFPVAEHHRLLAGTKLYRVMTEADGCGQLAQFLLPKGPGTCYSTAYETRTAALYNLRSGS